MRRSLQELVKSRMCRFLIVGSGAALLLLVLSYALVSLGMAPLPMAAATTIPASAASYVVSSAWVFPTTGRKGQGAALYRLLKRPF